MRAIKIDATNKTITEVEVTNLDDLQEAVGGWITVALGFENQDTLYVDDEGLLKNPEKFQFWYPEDENKARIFAGNGIIQGTSSNGDSKAAKSSIEEIKKNIRFIGPMEAYIYAKELGI